MARWVVVLRPQRW